MRGWFFYFYCHVFCVIFYTQFGRWIYNGRDQAADERSLGSCMCLASRRITAKKARQELLVNSAQPCHIVVHRIRLENLSVQASAKAFIMKNILVPTLPISQKNVHISL